MSDIFLSYKSEDREKAQKIAEAIEKKGYTVWWDRIIPPGRTFYEVIEEELDKAKCVVVLWSEKSIKAKWVITEASEGDRQGILVPILIEDVTPPFMFRMIEAAKLMDWDGTSLHHEFDLLIQSVGRILGRPAPVDSRDFEQKQKEQEEKAEKEKEEQEYLNREKEAKERLQEQKEKEERAKKEKEEQERILREEEKKTFINSIGMKFTLIPEGEFVMGSKKRGFLDKLFDEVEPLHKVTIHKPFYFSIYPVNQREWMAVMGKNPSKFKGDDLPVEQVSWDDVQSFIKNLNKNKGTDKYRLPSEAEWEYAARAGTTTLYFFGDNESELDEYAWYNKNSDAKTHPVGQKKPNPWGLYDMHGNVLEWVQDRWHRDYARASTDGAARVIRGGSWNFDAGGCRSAFRSKQAPGNRFINLGFRLLKEL